MTDIVEMIGWHTRSLIDAAAGMGDAWHFVTYEGREIGTWLHHNVKALYDHLLQAPNAEPPRPHPPSSRMNRRCRTAWESWLRWSTAQRELAPILYEVPLVSPLGFGGTPDIYARHNGVHKLIDLKTSLSLDAGMVVQVSAYAKHLLEDVCNMHVDELSILQLLKSNGEAGTVEKVWRRDDPVTEKAVACFDAALLLYQNATAIEAVLERETTP